MSSKREIVSVLQDKGHKGDPRFYELEKLVNKPYPYPLEKFGKNSKASSFVDLCDDDTINTLIIATLKGLPDYIPQGDLNKDLDRVIEEAIKFSTTKVLLTHVISILLVELEKIQNTGSSKYNIPFDLESIVSSNTCNSSITITYSERSKYFRLVLRLSVDRSDPNSGNIDVDAYYFDPYSRKSPRETSDTCHSIGMIVPVVTSRIQYFLDRAKKIHEEI